MATIIQQDAIVHSLFISVNCSTYFGWYFHPPSGAHNAVSTVSESGWMVTPVTFQPRSVQVAVTVSIMPITVDIVI